MKFKKLFLAMLIIAIAGTGTAMAKRSKSKKSKDLPKSINPYVKIQADFGYLYQDADRNKDADNVDKSDIDYYNGLLGTSRLGFNGQVGKVKGNVELGLSSAGASLRHAYATYDFGLGTVLMGHTWTPYTALSSLVRGGNFGIGNGATYDARQNQLKVSMFNAYISFMNTDTSMPTSSGITADNVDTLLPKTALGYEYKNDFLSVGPGLVFNLAQVAEEDGNFGDLDGEYLLAWMAYVHGKASFAALTLKFNLSFAMNPGNLGLNGGDRGAEMNSAGDGFENTKAIEGFVEAGYDLCFVNLVAGTAYTWSDNDKWQEKDQELSVYAQGAIPVEKNVKAVPYINYIEKFKNSSDVDEGKEIYVGLFGQIDI